MQTFAAGLVLALLAACQSASPTKPEVKPEAPPEVSARPGQCPSLDSVESLLGLAAHVRKDGTIDTAAAQQQLQTAGRDPQLLRVLECLQRQAAAHPASAGVPAAKAQ